MDLDIILRTSAVLIVAALIAMSLRRAAPSTRHLVWQLDHCGVAGASARAARQGCGSKGSRGSRGSKGLVLGGCHSEFAALDSWTRNSCHQTEPNPWKRGNFHLDWNRRRPGLVSALLVLEWRLGMERVNGRSRSVGERREDAGRKNRPQASDRGAAPSPRCKPTRCRILQFGRDDATVRNHLDNGGASRRTGSRTYAHQAARSNDASAGARRMRAVLIQSAGVARRCRARPRTRARV